VLDAEPGQSPSHLRRPLLVHRLAGLHRHEVVAAAIGVEARWQALSGKHLQARPKRRGGALLLDQERRIDLAGGVIHGHDQIERRLTLEPGLAAAVLVQHHACARLPRPLAPVRPAPLRPLGQARRMQLRLGPGVAPAEAMALHQVLVEVLHVPANILRAVEGKHPLDLVYRNPPYRGLAKPLVQEPVEPLLLVPGPVAPELPLRAAQQLACLHRRQLPPLPAAQYIAKLLHSPVL
jgi:hypothetical protein